jgi:acetylglutamate kinase
VSLLVVKWGGAVVDSAAASINALAAGNREVCVVHGAGPQISAEMERRGLAVQFVRGRRVTSAAGLAVVRESLAAVNRELCGALGSRALGLMGDEIGLEAIPLPELGFVGDPVPSRPAPVLLALEQHRLPVIAPLAKGPLNVNADEAAASLAVGLGAKKLVFVTDVPGVRLRGSFLPSIEAGEADQLLGQGTFEGGIVPKLMAAIRAARGGVDVHIGETAVVP